MFKLVCIFALISVAYCGVPLGLHAPVAAYGYAAPVAVAAPAVAVAPAVYVDNSHFSYGYLNPHGNGHVSVARTGPIDAHSYTFRSGTWVKK